ncbi:MAG: hypothetical protein F6K50_40730 [Moorea sp. SIO3I7]|uniref:hypothetical protein n=1 Tax=unclassified Moorena TaxID=2683338 RepID=UPI0013C93FFD|nr:MULTISPECIES: hypothetical protein [unclassified Moorena]NEO01494.1 hypothetical protein [Moorena sp. SIO3I7]NEO12355.1 hypothetical protein [Moorena sp. SIO3E8]NEO24530.1 hypothetical protein [Moorena sp. SIO4A5]NEP99355.1 hypothetical protein [Moorena sp. SIO3F7]NEQ62243.1 hypothetical protein [Moorena sp. SIO4A1]
MRCSLALAYWPRYANGPRGARLEPLRDALEEPLRERTLGNAIGYYSLSGY